MSYHSFIDKTFSQRTMDIINMANKILEDYEAQDLTLTLRQLYYQFVARDFIPNTQRDYKRLGRIISEGRLAGLIDWSMIVDRTRDLNKRSYWESGSHIIEACSWSFTLDLWKDQDTYIEVWIEKDALIGVIEPACQQWRTPYFACRGYVSQSELYRTSLRLQAQIQNGKKIKILHLGDHDPSGIDMTRDIKDKLELFCGTSIEVKRLALHMSQIEEYNPPPNPTKLSDSRAKDYLSIYGASSWELDALEPSVIDAIVKSEIESNIDLDKWSISCAKEEGVRHKLAETAESLDY